MTRKSRTGELIENSLGEHLALAVAAHLARSQLVAHPPKPYDAQHLAEQIDAAARALARVAPLYAADPQSGGRRELGAAELEGAVVQRAGALVVLRDGRKLSGVTLKRADLRRAIAILRLSGIAGLGGRAPQSPPAARKPVDLGGMFRELEELLRMPLAGARAARVDMLAARIARHAPGPAANLAMQLMSDLHAGRDAGPGLERLRAALLQAPA